MFLPDCTNLQPASNCAHLPCLNSLIIPVPSLIFLCLHDCVLDNSKIPPFWYLQTNFYFDSEEGGESVGPALCQMCEEGEEKEASHYCEECDLRLCGTCKRYHDRAPTSRNHQLEEYVAKSVSQPMQPMAHKKKMVPVSPWPGLK
jgi:hypothetical protein